MCCIPCNCTDAQARQCVFCAECEVLIGEETAAQGVLEDGSPDPSRTEFKDAALTRVRLLVGGQVVMLGALLQAAAAVQEPEVSDSQAHCCFGLDPTPILGTDM